MPGTIIRTGALDDARGELLEWVVSDGFSRAPIIKADASHDAHKKNWFLDISGILSFNTQL
jgi:hypothetical protein